MNDFKLLLLKLKEKKYM